MSNTELISIIIAVIGCLVGIAGFISKRDSRNQSDAEWKGSVNAKLNMILGITDDVEKIKTTVGEHEVRIKNLEHKHRNDP